LTCIRRRSFSGTAGMLDLIHYHIVGVTLAATAS